MSYEKMQKVFVILACLPEVGTASTMNAQKVRFIGEYPTRGHAKVRIDELAGSAENTNPYVYWIEKAWRVPTRGES